MKDNRDSIDFDKEPISQLFIKLFVPSLLGLIFISLFNIVDGVFVGRGIGSNALAAVNIVAPLFLISTGVALMFATGVSIVASIHFSKNNIKAANINITQAFTVSFVIITIITLFAISSPEFCCHLLGGSKALESFVVDYLIYISPTFIFTVILIVGQFVMRLDGSPKYAMYTTVVPSVLNIFLDYLFIFPLNLGIKGAAIATSISEFLGVVLVVYYFLHKTNKVSIYRLKFSYTSIYLTFRNVGYMLKLGFSTFIGEFAISTMMIVGNYMFMKYLKEDGIAAFSVACYTFPLVFMFGNAIAQSSLPIVSYNYGKGNMHRVNHTFRLSVIYAIIFGTLITLLGLFARKYLINTFLESNTHPWVIAIDGFKYFSFSFILFTINLVLIGYYQSIEKATKTISFMLLRGVIFLIPSFVFLPLIFGIVGLWLAVPVSELITTVIIVICLYRDKKNQNIFAD